MTRKIAGTCLAAVLGFALSAAAQQTPQTAPQTPTTPQTAPTSPYPSSQSADSPSKSDKAGKSSKLTGCVQSGTTAGTFELTNIKGKSAMADSSASASSSSSPSASSGKTVKLVAAAGVDLSQHVGHQVEINGSWSAAASASASAPSSASAPTASASAGGDKEFNVTDVKMVSATCSAGTN
jgi:hypothetical protein